MNDTRVIIKMPCAIRKIKTYYLGEYAVDVELSVKENGLVDFYIYNLGCSIKEHMFGVYIDINDEEEVTKLVAGSIYKAIEAYQEQFED